MRNKELWSDVDARRVCPSTAAMPVIILVLRRNCPRKADTAVWKGGVHNTARK